MPNAGQVTIDGQDIVASVAAALQYMSYYHPVDFIRSLTRAYRAEQSAPARNAIAQILVNSRMSAHGKRPMCQDTGMVVVFASLGMDVRIVSDQSLASLIDDGVRAGYADRRNPLRASIVADPLGLRSNTRDNAPAVTHVELVPGNTLSLHIAAKGGGSENKTRFAVLRPGASLADWVVEQLPGMGAGWCPPGILGIGVGGNAEKAMLLAKSSLLQPIDMDALQARGAQTREEELRQEIFSRVNALGIGAQGLGGLTTVLDVKLATYPTHAASLPVALIPQCVADRHAEIVLDGSGPVTLTPPDLAEWPDDILTASDTTARQVDLDRLTRQEVATWRAGETLLLSGRMLTARDAAHRRIAELHAAGRSLPIELAGRALYYVGPVDAVADEVIGPAGPTTATRMDAYTDLILGECGALALIGKAERGPEATAAIVRHGAAYLTAVGGAAYLIARAITAARVAAFDDLGMEAIHEFTVKNMPVTVAVDVTGGAIHRDGPARWRDLRAATQAGDAALAVQSSNNEGRSD